MPPEPVPADPGWDDDLAGWPGPRPPRSGRPGWTGVASRRSAPRRRSTRTVAPLTEEELAEIREAAADELLAVEAATTGRRGPGQPGSARVFPVNRQARRPGSGLGWRWTWCRAARAGGRRRRRGRRGRRLRRVSERELVGVLCAWDRVEAHAAARKLAAVAELARRNPGPGPDRGVHRRPAGLRAGRVPRPGRTLLDLAAAPGNPAARHPGGAAGRDHHPVQGRDHRGATGCWTRPRPVPPRPRSWTGPAG